MPRQLSFRDVHYGQGVQLSFENPVAGVGGKMAQFRLMADQAIKDAILDVYLTYARLRPYILRETEETYRSYQMMHRFIFTMHKRSNLL